jgi:transcriptional antiterminator
MPLKRSKKIEWIGIDWDIRLLIYADDVNFLNKNINIIKKNIKVLLDVSKEVGLEVNTEKLSIYSYLVTRTAG